MSNLKIVKLINNLEMNNKLQRINNAIDQLNRVAGSVREMIKNYIRDIVINTNTNNRMSVNILVGLSDEVAMAYYPHLTAIWRTGNDIFFMIDDKEIEFDYINTYDLYTIINQLEEK